jgi:hypothetical protein
MLRKSPVHPATFAFAEAFLMTSDVNSRAQMPCSGAGVPVQIPDSEGISAVWPNLDLG